MVDELKKIVLKIVMVLCATFAIMFFLKPIIVIAAEFWTCSTCDTTVFIIITAFMFGGVIGIPLYKLIGIFYG